MAGCTTNLVAGDNILCTTLKSSTILRYLSAAITFAINASVINPCLDISGKQSKNTNDIITEVKRWETISDRREPITKKVIVFIVTKGTKLAKHNAHNIYIALNDWLMMGL